MLANALERAIVAGKTFPAIPEWADLEVPSALSRLYHLWQAIAADESESTIRGMMEDLGDQWRETLYGPPGQSGRMVMVLAALLPILAGMTYWYSARVRRHREELRQAQEALQALTAVRDELASLDSRMLEMDRTVGRLPQLTTINSPRRWRRRSATCDEASNPGSSPSGSRSRERRRECESWSEPPPGSRYRHWSTGWSPGSPSRARIPRIVS
jgi:hypothetical protein